MQTPEVSVEEPSRNTLASVASAKALLMLTRGLVHPAVVRARKTAFSILRRAYHALRVVRQRVTQSLARMLSSCRECSYLASSNRIALSLAHRAVLSDAACFG